MFLPRTILGNFPKKGNTRDRFFLFLSWLNMIHLIAKIEPFLVQSTNLLGELVFQFFDPLASERTNSIAKGLTKIKYSTGAMSVPKTVVRGSFVPPPCDSQSTASVENAVNAPKMIVPKCLILLLSFSSQRLRITFKMRQHFVTWILFVRHYF